MVKRRGFGAQLRPTEVYRLIGTCLPYLQFADMQEELGWLLYHYVLRHPIYVRDGAWEVERGRRALVEMALAQQGKLSPVRACAAVLLGRADGLAEEAWPGLPLLEARRRLALQLLAGVEVLLCTAAGYVRAKQPQPDPLPGVRARYANLNRKRGVLARS